MSVQTTIRCRAKLSSDCLDGSAWDNERGDLEEDGTWDGDTIVCDRCYIAIMPFTKSGQALHGEIADAIAHYRAAADYLAKHPDPAKLLAEAAEQREVARPGSPYYDSASACMRMAQAEIDRRERQARA